jgi:hypothetical protein
MEINSGKNATEVFMEKEQNEMKKGTRGRLARKRDQIARPTGMVPRPPPGSVWALVAGSASPST